jgi:hypothetical protein
VSTGACEEVSGAAGEGAGGAAAAAAGGGAVAGGVPLVIFFTKPSNHVETAVLFFSRYHVPAKITIEPIMAVTTCSPLDIHKSAKSMD